MSLIDELISIRNKKNRETIDKAIAFIEDIQAYADKERLVFKALGYVPIKKEEDK